MCQISKEEFLAYREVQMSGVTNMWNTSLVSELSGLSREQIMDIIKNYDKLATKYLVDAGD